MDRLKKKNQYLDILDIGNQITEGPRALLSPYGHDWMEKDISIYVRYHNENRVQHISLWSDSTMNKEKLFLKPLIRFVNWEKQNDLEKVRSKIEIEWPDVRIFLGYIKPELFDKLNSELIEIQELIAKINFVPLGVNLNRDVAAINRSDLFVDYEIWIRNGIQSMCHYSPLLDNDDFSKKVIALKNRMLESMDRIDFSGWKERYDSAFNTSSFDWDYKEINYR